MIIKTKFEEEGAHVVAFYNSGGGKKYYYIPYRGYEGVILIGEGDVISEEGGDQGFVSIVTNNGTKILVEQEAADDGLIYEMIEHNAAAVEEFWKRIDMKKM